MAGTKRCIRWPSCSSYWEDTTPGHTYCCSRKHHRYAPSGKMRMGCLVLSATWSLSLKWKTRTNRLKYLYWNLTTLNLVLPTAIIQIAETNVLHWLLNTSLLITWTKFSETHSGNHAVVNAWHTVFWLWYDAYMHMQIHTHNYIHPLIASTVQRSWVTPHLCFMLCFQASRLSYSFFKCS